MSESDISKLFSELRALGIKVDNLASIVNQAAQGEGFTRCGKHSVRLKQVEGSVELSHFRISGVKKWVIGGLITVVTMVARWVFDGVAKKG